MTTVIPGRPAESEFAPAYAGYIARVAETDPVAAMRAQLEITVKRLRAVSESEAAYRYAPGKWSVKEVVGHLADSERIFAYRALRFARADTTPLPGFDENLYVPAAGFDRRSLGDLVAELAEVRRATVALFRSLDEAAWLRRGTANGKILSVRALGYIIPGHERHHVEVLRTKYGVGG